VGFDVAGRLAEGVAAVNNTQIYVQACALRGYHHPDLTQHSAQVGEWFRTEDGLDLRLLDADCAVLRSVAQQAGEALEYVRAQIAALDGAWDGEGASAAAEFLRSHADSAARVTAAAETAAAAAERLRDELWRIIGDKADTTVSIDDRTSSQRTGWLTAARAVVAGGQVAEDANHVVDNEITPYVNTVIAGEWVPAMRASLDALGSVYREAVDAVASRTGASFDIPGDLGPRPAAVVTSPSGPVTPISGAATVPAAATPPPTPPGEPAPPPPMPAVTTNPAMPQSNPVGAAMPTVAADPAVAQPNPLSAAIPPLGGTPTGLPDPLGGAAGLPGRLAETLGSLFDAAPASGEPPTDAALDDPPEIPGLEPAESLEEDALDEDTLGMADDQEEAMADEEVADEEPADEVPADEEPVDQEAASGASGTAPADCPETEEAQSPAELPAPVSPPPAPLPPADPAATPCEIAADELPQVGE
jgi:hypothetical protein